MTALGTMRETIKQDLGNALVLHQAMLEDPNFLSGAINTDYVEGSFAMPPPAAEQSVLLAALAGAAYFQASGERDARSGNGTLGAWAGQERTLRSPTDTGWRR